MDEEKQLFYCFGCGAGGNIFDFVMRAENLDFVDALQFLAQRAGITLEEEQSTSKEEREEENRRRKRILEMNRLAARHFYENLSKPAASEALSYMQYAPLLFVSAKTGQRTTNIFEHINYVYNQSRMRVSTGMLNDVLGDATTRVQPPSDKGKRLKIYYMTQIKVAPPTFVIFCNNAELFHFSYQRYIENCLRDTFGFRGTPIKLIIRMKGEEV